MTKQKSVYRKNFSLIIAFIVLLSAILVVALLITYSLTRKYVTNEFSSKKIEVLEQTIRPYNDFFYNKIPRITSYQGYLNKASATEYASSVFKTYPFVKSVDFYHFEISNHPDPQGVHTERLNQVVRNAYHFTPSARDTGIIQTKTISDKEVKRKDDFNLMALKLGNFIQEVDTSRTYTSEETFSTFYDIKPNKISYINNPSLEFLRIYKDLLTSKTSSSVYPQDLMVFNLTPTNLVVKNTHPELYQHISIQQVLYYPLDANAGEKLITDEIALPGAFSGYKLYFQSDANFGQTEVFRRFLPSAGIIIAIYIFLLIIGWLIYRNLNVNHKLFKLQYDFINNFTHEFKTPVSVIKIAGSNLRSDAELSDRQRMHYGKILDQEADKLNELMNRLLSFTQLENRSILIKKEEIKLDEFVDKYINTFKIKYPDFKLSYDIKNVQTFQSDPVLLGSIFQNMIENAYKYSPPNRKEQHITVERVKKDIVFSFKDKGIGIPKREVDNIFRKFYRIESQYNQNGSVGLGLAFCKELVNFMNGDITVKSKLAEGSEFKIILPINP
ncbi:two-component sensor histidine kinase [Mucilaginibacter sp. PPCGB 2223]|uniref:sensor histidine kinase n=1 Tax=Mucilaginibacter sp. PPCGB 2223 TaxID=1886027 RepID=UPI000825CE60|nr:HAMP domain-containing sensor histidine kinase [Mucilaginibacter sp. PPCGB 2223]OCX51042.1 two-component sensor histidine kinase [Mucilaginibacter sp. PPCGB 2223]